MTTELKKCPCCGLGYLVEARRATDESAYVRGLEAAAKVETQWREACERAEAKLAAQQRVIDEARRLLTWFLVLSDPFEPLPQEEIQNECELTRAWLTANAKESALEGSE